MELVNAQSFEILTRMDSGDTEAIFLMEKWILLHNAEGPFRPKRIESARYVLENKRIGELITVMSARLEAVTLAGLSEISGMPDQLMTLLIMGFHNAEKNKL